MTPSGSPFIPGGGLIHPKRRSETDLLTRPSSHYERAANSADTRDCYIGSRSYSSAKDTIITTFKKLSSARSVSRKINFSTTPSLALKPSSADNIILSDSYNKQKGDGHANRLGISLLFRKFGCLEERRWNDIPIVNYIMKSLSIAPGSRNATKNVMRDVLVFGEHYNPKLGYSVRGKAGLIQDYDDCAKIIYRTMGAGLGLAQNRRPQRSYSD